MCLILHTEQYKRLEMRTLRDTTTPHSIIERRVMLEGAIGNRRWFADAWERQHGKLTPVPEANDRAEERRRK